MLKILVSGLLTVLLVSPSTLATAQTSAATAETLMRQSGLWQQLSDIAPQMRSGLVAALSQNGSRVTPDEVKRLSRTVDVAYAPDRLRSIALGAIAKGMNPTHVPALLAWYGSETGIAITKLEEAASADDRNPNIIAQEGAALLSTVSPSRRALLSQMVEVTRSAEAMITITINSAVAIQLGVARASPGTPMPSSGELRRALEAQRPQMLQAFTAMSLAAFAKAYASLPDPDLSNYVGFLKTAAGIHFMDLGLRALDAALVDAATQFGRGIPAASEATNT